MAAALKDYTAEELENAAIICDDCYKLLKSAKQAGLAI